MLSVRARSELIAFALLDKLKRSHEDYQLLAVAFFLEYGQLGDRYHYYCLFLKWSK